MNLKELFNDESKQWFTLSRHEIENIIKNIDKKDRVIEFQKQVIEELKR